MKVDVDWTHGAGHMQVSHQVTPEEADEALADIDAVWFDPVRTASLGAACG
ncbi:MAG: hypothetical protein ACLP5E_16630 [Streptosporangiaceae bacterium]